MGQYFIRRVLGLIPVALVVSFVVFLLIHLVPGDPVRVMLGFQADESAIEMVKQQLGLDRPLLEQYARWVGAVLTGDLGVSVVSRAPVAPVLLPALGVTWMIAAFATGLAVLLAVPLGTWAATRHRSFVDMVLSTISLAGLSIPSFWAGMMFIYLFAVKLRWFPATGYVPFTENWVEALRSITLPSVSLGLITAGSVARMTRTGMLDVLRQDFIRTARAKGVAEGRVVFRHALRNALVLVVTAVGLNLGYLLGGAAVVEMVFGLPGLGNTVVLPVLNRDYPTIQAALMVIAFNYMAINLLLDLAYAWLDPRIQYE